MAVPGRDELQAELEVVSRVETALRDGLYSVRAGAWRANAVSALAAAAAERAHFVSDELPEWQNETSRVWRQVLGDVWDYLEGDTQKYLALSAAIGEFLSSPLNHVDGQDGPDGFDRPQTVASYYAAASVVFGGAGVDFAVVAAKQIFDLVDIRYDGEMSPEREALVRREQAWLLRICQTVLSEADRGPSGFSRALIDQNR